MTLAVSHRTPARPPAISFEFFPPKNEAQAALLDDTVRRLRDFQPAYVSVTYGAAGSSQERSFGAVRQVSAHGVATAAHLTCAGASRDQLAVTIARLRADGIERFVALRGDPEGGLDSRYQPHPDGFQDTADLVRALKQSGAADVAVSAYPERHPDSADWSVEMATLKRKVDAGADRAITQFFYDNDLYEAYVERVRREGINIPIVPGIMPIHRFASVCGFAARCGASIPASLAARFEGLDPDSETHGAAAAAVAAEQVADLMRRGADAFHIYTLNRSELSEAICRCCGIIREKERAAA